MALDFQVQVKITFDDGCADPSWMDRRNQLISVHGYVALDMWQLKTVNDGICEFRFSVPSISPLAVGEIAL